MANRRNAMDLQTLVTTLPTRRRTINGGEDLYRNTSLEEDPLSRRQPPVVYSYSDSDSEATVSAISSAYVPRRHNSATQQDVTEHLQRERRQRLDTAEQRPNELGDELTALYRTEQPLRDALATILQQLKAQQPQLSTAFEAHMKNAAAITLADVRMYDVISWFQAAPGNLKTAVKDLQAYYHKEAHLRLQLARLDRTHNSMADWTADHVYSINRHGKAHYGFETTHLGYEEFTLRFEDKGRLLLRFLQANLDARIIRVEQAVAAERYSAKTWPNSVEKKVLEWIKQAEKYPEDKLNATIYNAEQQNDSAARFAGKISMTKLAAILAVFPDETVQRIREALVACSDHEENAKSLLVRTRAAYVSEHGKVAMGLVEFKDEGVLFERLLGDLRVQRERLEGGKGDVEGLREARQRVVEKMGEVKGLDEEGMVRWEREKAVLEGKVEEMVAGMVIKYGRRELWDWVKE